MKTKTVKFSLLIMTILAAFILSCLIAVAGPVNKAIAEEPATHTAQFISTSNRFRTDWESSPYGKNGYVIIAGNSTSGTSSYIYSNLYTKSGSGYGTTNLMEVSGYANNANNAYLKVAGNFVNPADALDLKIDKWAFSARAWRSYGTANTASLYAPGTTTNIVPRIDGWDTILQDSAIAINKTDASDLYITMYIYSNSTSIDVSVENPIDLFVYKGAQIVKNPVVRGATVAEAMAHYGALTQLTTKTITSKGFVTFKLQGAGEFQIVAARNPNATAATTSFLPFIGGYFLDNTQPQEPEAPNESEGVNLKTTADDWSGLYGNDGYIIFDYDAAGADSDNKKVAYTKGIYSDSNGAYTGKVAYTDESTKSDQKLSTDNTAKTVYEFETSTAGLIKSNALISRYGMNVHTWDEAAYGTANTGLNDFFIANELALPVAGKNQHMKFGGNSGTHVSNMSFTVTEDAVANDSKLYVTVFGNNNTMAGNPLSKSISRSLAMYNAYWSTFDKASEKVALATKLVEQPYATHYYITFEISEAGNYTIFAGAAQNTAGSLTAMFFDKTNPDISELSGEYSITYVLDGDSGNTITNVAANPESYTFEEGLIRLSSPEWTDDYKEFNGWYLGSDCVAANKFAGISIGLNIDLKLYPGFEQVYAISYDTGAGTNNVGNTTVKATSGGKITLKDAVSPNNYHFEGWYTTAEFTPESKVTGEFTVSKDITFYANYTEAERIAIVYVLDDGDNAENNPAEYHLSFGSRALAPATKDGYTFEGWFMDEDFEIEITAVPKSATEITTIYAKFTRNADLVKRNITYVLNGGVNASNPDKYEEGLGLALAAAVKDGYAFEGWYTEAAFTNKVTFISETKTGDITLHAKFIKISNISNIVYFLNGGINAAENPYKYTEGVGLTLADATKAGCTFEGWYTDKDFTNKVTSIANDKTGDVELYAKFSESKGCKSAIGGGFGSIIFVLVASAGVLFILRRKKIS